MSRVYMIYHIYDVDGGFGDSVTKEELIGMTSDKELANAYVAKYEDCQPYKKPYDTLYCHHLEIREMENNDIDINVNPWEKDDYFNEQIAEYKERYEDEDDK